MDSSLFLICHCTKSLFLYLLYHFLIELLMLDYSFLLVCSPGLTVNFLEERKDFSVVECLMVISGSDTWSLLEVEGIAKDRPRLS